MPQFQTCMLSHWCTVLFYWRVFAKIRPEKYDFELCKGFFMEKINQIRHISKRKNSKSPDFYEKFQYVAKNIEVFFFFFFFFFFPTSISRMYLNLAKLFSGWSPLWLHHNILKTNPVGGICIMDQQPIFYWRISSKKRAIKYWKFKIEVILEVFNSQMWGGGKVVKIGRFLPKSIEGWLKV